MVALRGRPWSVLILDEPPADSGREGEGGGGATHHIQTARMRCQARIQTTLFSGRGPDGHPEITGVADRGQTPITAGSRQNTFRVPQRVTPGTRHTAAKDG